MNFRLDWKKMTAVFILIVVLIGIMVISRMNEAQYYEIAKNEDRNKSEPISEETVSLVPSITVTENLALEEPAKPQKAIVYICGAVKTPIVAELTEEDRLNDAVQIAGGLHDTANREGVNLAMKLSDGAQYIIPKKGAELIINYDNGVSVSQNDQILPTKTKDANGKLNINTASAKDMEELTGIGVVIAERIVKYRDEHRGFKSVDELQQVEGIGDKKFENIKNEVTI